MRLLLDDMGRFPLLTAEEEIELAKRAGEGDAEAAERLVTSNLRLVVWVAKRYQRDGVMLADLVQEGVFGLMRAVEGYDWRRGNRFATYATHWVRQRIRRAVANQSRTIRFPGHVAQREQAIERAEAELLAELGRRPTEAELAQAARVSLRELHQIREAARAVTSLDGEVGDGDGSLGDIVAISSEDIQSDVEDHDSARTLRRVVASLPPRQREVLELRYGLGSGEPMTLSQVGHRVGLSRERVRQLEQQAFQSLSQQEALSSLRVAG